jgi:hypothetical protein
LGKYEPKYKLPDQCPPECWWITSASPQAEPIKNEVT